ncbi:MAG: molybdate ABC transporter substrate-binding protein [Oscillospiraceae bacterium]
MKKALSIAIVLSLVVMLLAGCNGGTSSTPSTSESEHEPVTMLVAAAASLKTSYDEELIPMFQEKYPWITVEGTYDSSGKLQTQIEEGLEASVFMSAATKQMTALTDSGFIDGASVINLLENEIVLIVPIDSDSAITSFEEIVNAETIAVGDPASVPAGQYAEEALTSLGVWDAIQDRVSLGTNVTEVLNAVAEGSADVGIVYATDAAQMTDKVKIVATAPEGSLETKVIYPVGILTEAPQSEAAALFVEFLQTKEAMDVFIAAGFKSNI